MNARTRAAIAALAAAAALATGACTATVNGTASAPTMPPGVVTTANQPAAGSQTQQDVDVVAIWRLNELHTTDVCRHVYAIPNGVEIPDWLNAIMPSAGTVEGQLTGVFSPGDESWVHDKLAWTNQWLYLTRFGMWDRWDTNQDKDRTPEEWTKALRSNRSGFDRYVNHVRDELAAGHDIADKTIDNMYPDSCAHGQ